MKNPLQNRKKAKKENPANPQPYLRKLCKRNQKKTVIDKPHYLGSEETDAPEQVKKWFVTVKRNWEGIPNYFPSSSKFDVYVPPNNGAKLPRKLAKTSRSKKDRN